MIKFVCSSCGERLSVPDQHAGRKGVCPSCHAVNRIPLKGMPQAQPVETPAAIPQPAVAQPASVGAVSQAAAPSATPSRAMPIPAEQFAPAPRPTISSPAANHSAPPARRATSTPQAIPESSFRSSVPNTTPFAPIADDPAEMVELRKERRLPKPVKMTLLVIAALVLVGALYFGLLFALHAMIPQN